MIAAGAATGMLIFGSGIAHADQVIEGCHWNEAADAWQYPDSSLCRGTGEDPTSGSDGLPACADGRVATEGVFRFAELGPISA